MRPSPCPTRPRRFPTPRWPLRRAAKIFAASSIVSIGEARGSWRRPAGARRGGGRLSDSTIPWLALTRRCHLDEFSSRPSQQVPKFHPFRHSLVRLVHVILAVSGFLLSMYGTRREWIAVVCESIDERTLPYHFTRVVVGVANRSDRVSMRAGQGAVRLSNC